MPRTSTAHKRIAHPPDRDAPEVTRWIAAATRHQLIARAAGRCEFRGCNRFLFAHPVTKRAGYLGNYAHIRGFAGGGPRSVEDAEFGRWIHQIDNLMLLCTACHGEVDSDPAAYPVEALRAYKREHEERVAFLLDLPAANECAMLEVWTNVAAPPVVRGDGLLIEALRPLYPSRLHRYLIDFAGKPLSDITLIPTAAEQIDRELERLFSAAGERPAQLAVFGITTIPLLVHLGARLGDRIQVHLFRHHRDCGWRWKDEPATARFESRVVRRGRSPERVALVLSMSGVVDPNGLPSAIDDTYTVRELRLASETPNLDFLRTREDLSRFRAAYRALLADVRAEHPRARELPIFPAVPVPIAIAIGMDRLPKVDATLAVHDYDRTRLQNAGWRPVLSVG
jgi:hypothetical protein